MAFSEYTRSEASAEAAWRATLADLIEKGVRLDGEQISRELLGYSIVIDSPRRRLIDNHVRPLPLISAIARFVWMMAGNSRLADIYFYESQVERYTDDGLRVPGSDYGARLRQPYPGSDQVRGAISRLLDGDNEVAGSDGKLRRAANVIWKPEDALRISKDIPCAFGLFYFPRDGSLLTQLVMRSNNAVALMPFNIFEFTLLAEIVAIEAGLDLGPFRIDAMSMHAYDRDRDRVTEILASPSGGEFQMPPIPATSDPLGQLDVLAKREAELRHQLHTLAGESLEQALARGEGLNSYWRPFFEVLLAHALAKADQRDRAREVAGQLPEYFSQQVTAELEKRFGSSDVEGPARLSVPEQTQLLPISNPGEEVARALHGNSIDVDHLHMLLDEIEQSESIRLSHTQGDEVAQALEAETVDVAARSEGEGGAEDFKAIDRSDVLRAIRNLGFDR
jgi:thymidylate synthase